MMNSKQLNQTAHCCKFLNRTSASFEEYISNGAMLVFLKKQFPQVKITVHGFRATFKTWAEETGNYQHHAIEFCLAHQLPSKVEKAYLRTNLTEQRKQIMDNWEKYVLSN